MADANDRFKIQLIDAGNHKDRVLMVLSKVKGLTMAPQQVVQNTPCTMATDVPRNIAEKLREYLERAGAMVMLEGEHDSGEDELFTPDEFPLAHEAGPEASDELAGDGEALNFEPVQAPPEPESDELSEEPEIMLTANGMVESPESQEEPLEEAIQEASEPQKKENIYRKLLVGSPTIRRQKAPAEATPNTADQSEYIADTKPAEEKSSMTFLEKLRKPEPDFEGTSSLSEESAESSEAMKKKMPDLFSSPIVFALVGALAGGLIMGVWGWTGIQKQRQERLEYESLTAQQITVHSAQLKGMVAELSQQVKTLQQQNKDLERKNLNFVAQTESAKGPGKIVPTGRPMEMSSWEQELVRSFQAVMQRHAKVLENGPAAQEEAGCSQQVLLDGKSTLAYAQVVKNFSAQYTRYDVRRSDSLVTPYIAELKIPFQQEIRSGATQEACQSATLHQEDAPIHHEFGGYYGYWTLEYLYSENAWVLNTSVIERNRALYDNAFRSGGPEFAKFKIDTTIFPELANPHSQ